LAALGQGVREESWRRRTFTPPGDCSSGSPGFWFAPHSLGGRRLPRFLCTICRSAIEAPAPIKGTILTPSADLPVGCAQPDKALRRSSNPTHHQGEVAQLAGDERGINGPGIFPHSGRGRCAWGL